MELATEKTLKWPVWRHEEKFYVSIKDITGAIAMWAVKQSPYSMPDNLPQALEAIGKRIASDWPFTESGFSHRNLEDIRVYLIKIFEELPETIAWNTPKINTGAQYVFTDRYTEIKPDYDFIDLHALARNVVHTIGREHFY